MRVGLGNQSRTSCVRGFICSSVPSVSFALSSRALFPLFLLPETTHTDTHTHTRSRTRSHVRTCIHTYTHIRTHTRTHTSPDIRRRPSRKARALCPNIRVESERKRGTGEERGKKEKEGEDKREREREGETSGWCAAPFMQWKIAGGNTCNITTLRRFSEARGRATN